MARSVVLWSVVALAGPTAWGQNLVIQERIGGGLNVGFGRYEVYPPNPNPYAGRLHGPSLYSSYGQRRLEGRVLWMPAGVSPPGPQAIERYTVGRVGRPSLYVSPAAPVVPRRYPHTSYIRSNQHTGYVRRR